MKVALPRSPFNRADLFEAAGFEVVEGPVRSTEDFIELMKDADGAQVGRHAVDDSRGDGGRARS